ncbi:MAG: serine/threonine protein kinase [Deltaproteobacteria bacterium]|nr:serine/threonine protein kinase [Deltaproteobacteria bacterium]
MESKGSTGRHERAEPRDGTIIAGRYQVDRLIARGGMAAVYLAHHVKLNRPVALKILSPPPDAEDPGAFEERFQLEAETLASLDHPNIVILHDFGETVDGRFFLAMEFVEGPRLSDALRDGPLPSERALHLIMQVCAALRYAHKRGVVHRDLKPSNLLIRRREDGEEKVKVVDFGLVKLTEADQSITRAGLILGSPHCMAPEQVKGLDVDHRADIYATGVLMFRALTGQYPFHGPNSAATMIAHLNQPVPTFFSVAPELVAPAGLEEIVRKCLSKSPNDRYPDMQSLMDDLALCMNVPPEQFRSVSQSHSTIQRQMSTGWGGKGILLALVLALLLIILAVVVGGGVLVATRTSQTGTPHFAPPVTAQPEPTLAQDLVPGEADVEEEVPAEVTEEPIEEGEGEEEETTAEPEPVAAPAPPPVVAKPRPRPPARPKPKPQPEPAATTSPEPSEPEEGTTEETNGPEGYMGLPEDLK